MRNAFRFPVPVTAGAAAAAVGCALSLLVSAAQAAPAPWYYWRSMVDGTRACAQTSPGPGWERDSAAYDGPGCAPRPTPPPEEQVPVLAAASKVVSTFQVPNAASCGSASSQSRVARA